MCSKECIYLIRSDLASRHQTEESLLRVNVRLGRGPAGGVGGVTHRPVLDVLPLRHQRDRVLARSPQHVLRHHARAGPGGDADTPGHTLHAPDVEINVVAVEVVGDVTAYTSPGLECLQLELGLTHVACKKVKLAQLLYSHPGIVVDRVKSLVNFNLKQNILLPGLLHQLLVLGERLHHGLGGHHMDPPLQSRQDNVIVSVIWSEHGTDISGFGKLVKSFNISFRIKFIVLEYQAYFNDTFVKIFVPEETAQKTSLTDL